MLALNDENRAALRAAQDAALYMFGSDFIKNAGTAEVVQPLAGRLYLSESGWGLLAVPNALIRGLFDALNEPGAELPLKDGRLNGHISVFHPKDIEKIGGPDKLHERGHSFTYGLGAVKCMRPSNWGDVAKVWYVEVRSKSLEDLRKGYGLSAKPKDGKFDLHATFAVRKKHVLRENEVSKTASTLRWITSLAGDGMPYPSK
jgi:hypothetical protein